MPHSLRRQHSQRHCREPSHQHLSTKHIGVVDHGTDDTISDEVKAWTPATKNYTFSAIDETHS